MALFWCPKGAVSNLFLLKNGSPREPKWCHFWWKGTVSNLFLETAPLGSRFGAILQNSSLSSEGTIFFLNMIIKEKTAPFLQKGAVFQNGAPREPFQLPFFECTKHLQGQLTLKKESSDCPQYVCNYQADKLTLHLTLQMFCVYKTCRKQTPILSKKMIAHLCTIASPLKEMQHLIQGMPWPQNMRSIIPLPCDLTLFMTL